jgi:hypothetical protein
MWKKCLGAVTVTCVITLWVFVAPRPATASWQLIPGKTYDGCRPSALVGQNELIA